MALFAGRGKNLRRIQLTCIWLIVFCLIAASVYADTGDAGKTAEKVGLGGDAGGSSNTALPDLFSGAMTYRVPIEVPPGRNGMDPDLAFAYRSGSGNGWVGVGWELEMGAIERSTKFGVDYSKNDYVLRSSGVIQELVAFGAIDPLAPTDEFRAKIESGFSRMIRMKSPDTGWVVITAVPQIN